MNSRTAKLLISRAATNSFRARSYYSLAVAAIAKQCEIAQLVYSISYNRVKPNYTVVLAAAVAARHKH